MSEALSEENNTSILTTSDGGYDNLTAAEVLTKLEQIWKNEKFAPELLSHESQIIDIMLDQIQEMEENIKRTKKGDFRALVHKMEVDRIRYMIADYLRIRLRKIEKFVFHVLEEHSRRESEGLPALLKDTEHKFATEYKASMMHHFNTVAMKHMPPNMQEIDTDNIKMRPNMNHYVFATVDEDVDGVVIEEDAVESRDEVIDMEKKSQYIIPYKPVSSLLHDGQLHLI